MLTAGLVLAAMMLLGGSLLGAVIAIAPLKRGEEMSRHVEFFTRMFCVVFAVLSGVGGVAAAIAVSAINS